MAQSNPGKKLHLKKYANRRYYDAANSRHLKLQEIYELVKSGLSIQVADGQNGNDITSEVLLTILLEFEPGKAAAVPESILSWWIRMEAENLRALARTADSPIWKALINDQHPIRTEIKRSPAMREIIPAVKDLAKEAATSLKETMAPAGDHSSKSDRSNPTQTSQNEDLEELIRALDAADMKQI